MIKWSRQLAAEGRILLRAARHREPRRKRSSNSWGLREQAWKSSYLIMKIFLDRGDCLYGTGITQKRAQLENLPTKRIGPILTYRTYIESSPPELAANTIICLIHQTNFLLDQQLRQLERDFLERGGFTERLYKMRKDFRRS
jgi:four helix bundle suffix protein